jgi:uncharacterized protein (TIGR01777 family)
VERHGGIHDGARVRLDFGFPLGNWTFEHFGYQAGRVFRDRQVAGPFARFEHTHTFEPASDGCVLEDRIEYEPPLPPLGRLASGRIHGELVRLFAWRHRLLRVDLERARARDHRPLAMAVSGASGMVGRELVPYLTTQGCTVRRLVRHSARAPDEVSWDPARGTLDPASLAGVDAVIHLAGAGIAERRWTRARRHELMESRTRGTGLLARTLAALPQRPRVMVSASAIGRYGDRGDALLDESSARGTEFLAEVCREWEAAAQRSRDAGAGRPSVHRHRPVADRRSAGVARARDAMACGRSARQRRSGGAGSPSTILDKMMRAVDDPAISGLFNAVAPTPARQHDVARLGARRAGRPPPAPAFALRAVPAAAREPDPAREPSGGPPGLETRLHPPRPGVGHALARMFGRAAEDAGEVAA